MHDSVADIFKWDKVRRHRSRVVSASDSQSAVPLWPLAGSVVLGRPELKSSATLENSRPTGCLPVMLY